MKKLLLLILLIQTTLSAKTELKEGKYSWFSGWSEAYLTITKEKGERYHIKGDCYYGVSRKYGPNMGNLDFTATLKNSKIVHEEKLLDDEEAYAFTLTVNKDGSLDVNETGMSPFGHNASFYGHFTSADLPSFPCEKASGFVEHAICDNVKIARLDRSMAQHYARYKNAFFFHKNKEALATELKKEQRTWIKSRNACKCKMNYKGCLIGSYEKRVEKLKNRFEVFWEYK